MGGDVEAEALASSHFDTFRPPPPQAPRRAVSASTSQPRSQPSDRHHRPGVPPRGSYRVTVASATTPSVTGARPGSARPRGGESERGETPRGRRVASSRNASSPVPGSPTAWASGATAKMKPFPPGEPPAPGPRHVSVHPGNTEAAASPSVPVWAPRPEDKTRYYPTVMALRPRTTSSQVRPSGGGPGAVAWEGAGRVQWLNGVDAPLFGGGDGGRLERPRKSAPAIAGTLGGGFRTGVGGGNRGDSSGGEFGVAHQEHRKGIAEQQSVTVTTKHRLQTAGPGGWGGEGASMHPTTQRAIKTTLDLMPPWLVALVPTSIAGDRGRETTWESLNEMHEALTHRLIPDDADWNDRNPDDDAFGVEQSMRRLSPDNLRRFGVRPKEAAYLYRCLAGFSAGFHNVVMECTHRVVGQGGSAGEDDDEDAKRRLLLSSVWRVYAALWEAEMGGAFDCTVLGIIQAREEDAAAIARSEQEVAAALMEVEAERRRADAAAEKMARALKSTVAADAMQNALGDLVNGIANEKDAKQMALKEIARLQDASRSASMEYARQRQRADEAAATADEAKDAAFKAANAAEEDRRARHEAEVALAEVTADRADCARRLAAALESANAVADERKTHARTTALLRGDNEVLREKLAAAEEREATLRSDIAELRNRHASTTMKLRGDCQRRQAALETSRTQNAMLATTLAAKRKESAEREVARLALEAELAATREEAVAAAAAATAAAAEAATRAAEALEAQRQETIAWETEAKTTSAALSTLRKQHDDLSAAHEKLRREAGGLAECVERLQGDLEVAARAVAAGAARESALRDDLAASRAEIASLKIALDAEKVAHATAVDAAAAAAAVAAKKISGLTEDLFRSEELVARLRLDIDTLQKWKMEAETKIAQLEGELKKHRVAAMLAKAVGESREGVVGERLRACEAELEEARAENARLAAQLKALQLELERTREEAANAAEIAARAFAGLQEEERQARADLGRANARVRETESWLQQWNDHARRAMKRATGNHFLAATAVMEFSVAAEQERVRYNQPGGWKNAEPPPEIPLLQEWSGDTEGLETPPGYEERFPPPPRAREGGTPMAVAGDALGPPDDRLDWLGSEAKRHHLAMHGAGELFKKMSGELDAARRGGRAGRSAMTVLKVALRFRIEQQEAEIAKLRELISKHITTEHVSDEIAERGLKRAETLVNESVGLLQENNAKTEGALVEYEGAIKAAAYNAKSVATRVEQIETDIGELTHQLFERCAALARQLDAEQTAHLLLQKKHSDLIASAGDAAASALEAARQRQRAEAAEERATRAEVALKLARWKLTMVALSRARIEGLTRERDGALRASAEHASRAAAAETQRNALIDEVEELTKRVKELEAALREKPTSEALAEARAGQVALSAQLKVLRRRLTECEARCAAAEAKAATLDEMLKGKVVELETVSAEERAARERIVALEHELGLLRDRISELEAALEEANAELLKVSNERDTLKGEVLRLTGYTAALNEEIAMLKTGDQAIVLRVAKHVKHPFIPTVKTMRVIVGHILAEKAAADIHDDETPGNERQTLDHFVYDYFMLRFGIRQVAESHIAAFVQGIKTHWERGGGGRLGAFGAMLGCLPGSGVCGIHGNNAADDTGADADAHIAFKGGPSANVLGDIGNDMAAIGFYLHVRCAVFSRCGGIPASELEDGVAQVPVDIVLEVVSAALGPVAPAADIIKEMAAAGALAERDGTIDLDRALAAALIVWSRARAQAGDRIVKIFDERDENGDGVLTWAEFSTFADEVSGDASDPLTTRQKKELFREAINRVSNESGSGKAEGDEAGRAGVSSGTLRSVVMSHGLGFLPVAPALEPLAPASGPPLPFDEFGLLQEAWSAAEKRSRTALEGKKRDEDARLAARGGDVNGVGAGDAEELVAMVEQFTELVGAAAPGTEKAAWQLLRRVLLAVYLWEQGGEMKAREQDSKVGAAAYGSVRLGTGDMLIDPS